MVRDEQYLLYKFSEDLVKNHQYNVFYLNETLNEVWLEKSEKRTTKIIRLFHKGFDWKNHLKRDIAFLFQRIKNVKSIFKRNIEIYNLYFTEYPPVDKWESLKKPLTSQGKPQMKMKVYYLDSTSYLTEIERFEKDALSKSIDYETDVMEEGKEDEITAIKQWLISTVKENKREVANIFNYGKPFFTYVFLIISVIGFTILELNGDSTSIETLVEYGAKYNPAILIDGEWWRLITSMFLHIGVLHLLLNSIALYYLGSAVERIFGNARFLLIYFVAGIGGSLASFTFSTSVSAGASGAIFGLFGALLYFGVMYRRIFFQTIGTSLIFIILINLVLGVMVDGIDMAAHTGGLIFGFFGAAIVSLPKKKLFSLQMIATLVTIASLVGLTFYGVQVNANSSDYKLQAIQYELAQESYDDVISLSTEFLELADEEWQSILLFQRAYAYIELEEYEQAIEDLEESITYDNPIPESYYNLALLYQMNGDEEAARRAIEQAYEINPAHDDYQQLYEEITGEEVRE